MDKDLIIEKVKSREKDGKIACKQALRIAEETGIPSGELGALLNDLKIKVMGCQLGCFP
ncbi:MAG: hypothetical protein JXA35_07820 [Deltaproteobacteria bacterium]|nr:hypothetical protein [Deltaproteobacteria bacterium]